MNPKDEVLSGGIVGSALAQEMEGRKRAMDPVKADFFAAVALLKSLKVFALPQWDVVVGSQHGTVEPLRKLGCLNVQVPETLTASHLADVAAYAPALKFSLVSASRFPIA